MQDKSQTVDKLEDATDDQSDDLSLSIPLPPTPASVCSFSLFPSFSKEQWLSCQCLGIQVYVL